MKTTTAAWLLVAAGTIASASGEPMPPPCVSDGTDTTISRSLTVSYTIENCDELQNQPTVPGAAAAWAQYTQMFVPINLSCCSPEYNDDNAFDAYVDPGDLKLRNLSAFADVPRGTGQASMTLCSGTFSTASSTYIESYRRAIDENPCTPCGSYVYFELGSAGANGTARWTSVAAEAVRNIEHEVSMWQNTISHPCFGPSPRSADLVGVDFVSATLVYELSNSSTQTDTLQGVYAYYSDQSVLRLGAFADPAFDPVPGAGGYTIAGSVAYQPPVPNGTVTATTVSTDVDSFGEFDGDIDRDGIVCWNDRGDLSLRLGSSLGSEGYTARADFNLDGSISQSDVTAFNQKPCTADVDCDGSHTNNDFLMFQVAYQNGDPAADMNGDGMFTLSDYTAFQVAYSLGCP